MKNSKTKQLSHEINMIDENMNISEMDINPIIYDYMIRKTFNMFDGEGAGEVTKEDFIKLIDILGIQNDKKSTELARELDKSGTGKIDFDSFINILSECKTANINQDLEGVFKNFDKDMDTQITINDLLRVSQELDEEQISEDDAKLMIAFFKYFSKDKAKNSNGVSKEEFIIAMSKLNFLIYKNENYEEIMNNKNSFLDNSSNIKSHIKKGSRKSMVVKNPSLK